MLIATKFEVKLVGARASCDSCGMVLPELYRITSNLKTTHFLVLCKKCLTGFSRIIVEKGG